MATLVLVLGSLRAKTAAASPTDVAPELPQPASSDATAHWRTNLFHRFVGGEKLLARSWWPSESRRLSFTVPLLAGVAAAVADRNPTLDLDTDLERSIAGSSGGGRHEAAVWLTRLGDTPSAVLLVGSTYLIAHHTGHTRMERATSLSAEALLHVGVYSAALKTITRRTRPAAGGDGRFFADPVTGQSADSFPSGHAMGAFAVATVFAGEYRDNRLVPWLVYGGAGLIGLSRIALGRHFPSDMLVGGVLGHSIGSMVVAWDAGEVASPKRGEISPMTEWGGRGVGVGYRRSW